MKQLKNLSFDVAAPIIRRSVLQYFKITTAAFDSSSRKRNVVRARQIAHYYGMFCKGSTLTKVGMAFGGKDHTTVLHSCQVIDRFIGKVNDLVVDAETYRATKWIEFYIQKELNRQNIDVILRKLRDKRLKYHIYVLRRGYCYYKKLCSTLKTNNK